MPPAFSIMRARSLSLSCLSNRARRPASDETVSLSLAPNMTLIAKSLSDTLGLVIKGWLAVLTDLVTPIASTIT